MKACCIQGSLHPGTPTGRVTTLHGLPVYITAPPADATQKGAIVFLPDAFGWDMPNNRLLADRYSRRTGATVYLPDFMNGGGFPAHLLETMETVMNPVESWMAVLTRKTPAILRTAIAVSTRITSLSDGSCRPRIISFLSALRANEAKGLKIGVAGFCWGGHHTFDLCAGITDPEDPEHTLIDAGYTAHPSNVKTPVDFENVKLPICVAIGDCDFAMGKEKCEQGKEVLDRKGDESRYEMKIIQGAKHGFAMRWKLEDESELSMAKDAEDMAVRFWARWLGTDEKE